MLVDGYDLQRKVPRRSHGRLLWRILQNYAVITEPMQIGPFSIDFTRVADPNIVLNAVALEEDRMKSAKGVLGCGRELHLPYWAELWDSALGLATFLVNQWSHCGAGESAISEWARQRVRSDSTHMPLLRALDLGCGMGLSGAVAARLGMQVLFADFETPALLFAELNSLPDQERCRTRKIDWQTDRLSEQFDLILGADIVYDRAQWGYLERFFQVHLAPGGAVLIGEPGRSSAEEFETWASARGWKIQIFTQAIPARESPIRMLQLKK